VRELAQSRNPSRARRWDAVVLGGALPGLVAAARLCLAGHRVLVVEEESAARLPPVLREPFLLTGALSGGVLASVLRELSVPLIDQRRLEADPLAYQVVLPDARIDVGSPARTTEELVAWGLAKPDAALPLLRALARAASAERDAMLASPVLRSAGLRRLSRAPAPPTRHARGMPAEAAAPPPELVPFLEAQVRALSNLASADPGPEARARLLGSALEGGAAFPTAEHTLRGLLRERISSLHGEFRPLAHGFGLVEADGEPGLAPARSSELWLGRTLVVNAPRGLVARALRQAEQQVPAFLDAPPPPRRRLAIHLRARREVVPEGMARRVVRVADPARPIDGTNAISIAVYPVSAGGDVVDLVASAVLDAGERDGPGRAEEIEAAVRSLLPFSEQRVRRHDPERPRWDDDAALDDPLPGAAWPAEIEIRVSARPPVHLLDRSALGGLGIEGDLLLGWRAGERIAAELGPVRR
jgi:hypothetical protein